MLRSIIRLTSLATALATVAACTQAASPIDLRGSNSYTQGGASYASTASLNNYAPASGGSRPIVSQATQSSASVSSIGVSDLSAPSSGNPASTKKTVWGNAPQGSSPQSTNTPFRGATQKVASVDVKPVTAAVNPWTKKPRDTANNTAATAALDESFHLSPKGKPAAKPQLVSEVQEQKTAAAGSGAKLDSIVDSSEAAAPHKEVVLTHKIASDAGPSGLMWPVNSKKILSDFGPKGKGKVNDGVNIASAEGEPVWASADGEVLYVGNELQGYGNMVIIKHPGTKSTTYAHLNRYTVDKYDRVKQGDIIGYVGTTGNVKAPQLHFAVRDGKDPVDPLKSIKRDVASR